MILRRPEPADADAPIWFGITAEEHLAFAEEHWRVHGFGPWTAVLKETGDPVAAVDLHIAVEARGLGLATEAAAAVIAYAFDTVGVDEVVAYTAPGNAASLRVMDKLGMTRRGEGRSRDRKPAVIFVARRAPLPPAAC